MNIRIHKSELNGTVELPVSKSQAHRVLIAAFMTGEEAFERLVSSLGEEISDDIRATIGCLRGIGRRDTVLDAGESGSTLRFLLPFAAAAGHSCTFRMGDSLSGRPVDGYEGILAIEKMEGTVTVSGKLHPGNYHVPGEISSQYITGMLFALSSLEGRSRLIVSGELKSRPYVDMTVNVLRRAGIFVEEDDTGFQIEGRSRWHFADSSIERDWSPAGFYLVLRKLGARIEIPGLSESSLQGDSSILEILSDDSRKLILDLSDIPDLAPVLAFYGTGREPGTELSMLHADRLKVKESDRAEGIRKVINSLGGRAEYTEENGGTLTIHGMESIRGGECETCRDHRLIMMAACLSYISETAVCIRDAQYVQKSYPGFFSSLKSIGWQFETEV